MRNAISDDDPVLRVVDTDRDVEVLVDGVWLFGQLGVWRLHRDAGWVGQVRFWVAAGDRRIGVFAADEIRAVGADEGPETGPPVEPGGS